MRKVSIVISFVLALLLFSTGWAEVLFEEKFEDGAFSERGWYDAPRGTLSNTEHISGSTYSFECKFLQGERGCSGGTPGRHLFSESETVYLTYYVKYSVNWEGSNMPYHPHEFHFVTNLDNQYVGPARSYLTTYIEQNEGTPRLAIQDSLNVDPNCILLNNNSFQGCNGNFGSYVFTENRSVSSCNGLMGDLDERDCYNTGSYWYSSRGWSANTIYFQESPGKYYKNDWHLIEAMFKMNTIQGAVGVPDGQIRYWFDGELLISYDQILLRTGANPDMRFNQFLIAPYIGPGSPLEQIMWIDDLTVSTHRLHGHVDPPPEAPVNFHIISP